LLDKPLFRSKRFISAVIGVVIMIIVAFVPELATYELLLVEQLTQIVVALIAGYSLTDIAREWLNRQR